jgi:hypothetical protein
MKIFKHGANNIYKLDSYNYDGLEIDFQLWDNNFINTHHFYFGSPFLKKNWVNKLKLSDLNKYQIDGECFKIDDVLKQANNGAIIIDLKNWILKIPGIIFNNSNPYLYNQKYFAKIFCNTIIKYTKQKNIMIQSYDHKLIVEIIKELNRQKINHNFQFGLIIRTDFQVKGAIKYLKDYPISFLAIRYKKIKVIKKLLNKEILIYGWFDLDDFLISNKKRLRLIKTANCDGYIK